MSSQASTTLTSFDILIYNVCILFNFDGLLISLKLQLLIQFIPTVVVPKGNSVVSA